MPRRRLALGIVLVLIVSAITYVSMWSPIAAELKSPEGTYTVRLRGNLSVPKWPFLAHNVQAEVLKGEGRIVRGHQLHFADWFDTGFSDLYPYNQWLAENVIRFQSNPISKRESTDKLTVENKSSQTACFVKVRTSDLFLVLEVQPQGLVQLQSAPIGDRSWVEVTGQWCDGSAFQPALKDLNIRRSSIKACEYVIRITEIGAEIRVSGCVSNN